MVPEPNDHEALSPAQHAAWWREWSEHGPQGPMTDEPDAE
jgi:hypothetical protein